MRLVKDELRDVLTYRQIIFLLLICILPIIYAITPKLTQRTYETEIELYLYIMNSGMAFMFPLLAVSIYLLKFSNELPNRYAFYARFRSQSQKYIKSKLFANALIVFCIIFLLACIPFLFVYYIEPIFNIVAYGRPHYAIQLESEYATFTQLLAYSKGLYIVVYAVWVAINAVIFSTIGFFSLLYINNRFVALTVPLLVYFLGAYISANLKIPVFSFIYMLFPLTMEQQAIWAVMIPFVFLLIVVMILYRLTRKKINELPNLL